LYLATVKDALAILVSFSAEKNKYNVYNPIFDKAIKTIRIVAKDELLFQKNKQGSASDFIGIQVPAAGPMQPDLQLAAPSAGRNRAAKFIFPLALVLIAAGVGAYIFSTRRKKNSHSKSQKPRPK
jgi:hypothetical protein